MKLYDMIWVYDNQGDAVVENKNYSIAVSEKNDVIVLTRDEAFDLWMAAMDYCDQADGKKDFTAYLQSKGIYID